MKAIVLIAAVAVLFSFGGGGVQAQGTKAGAKKCPANYIESCIKRCTAAGGRSQRCGSYCAAQQAKNC